MSTTVILLKPCLEFKHLMGSLTFRVYCHLARFELSFCHFNSAYLCLLINYLFYYYFHFFHEMRHSEPTYFHMPDKRERKKLFFFSARPQCSPHPKPEGVPRAQCIAVGCQVEIDRRSFHTVIGRVAKSEKFKSYGISSLRFHNQARFDIRSHLFVFLFVYLFVYFRVHEKTEGKNRLRCRFSPCDSMFFRFVYSAHSVSARVCVCVTAGCAAAKGRSLTICKLLFFSGSVQLRGSARCVEGAVPQ